jgi:hypothetical protein
LEKEKSTLAGCIGLNYLDSELKIIIKNYYFKSKDVPEKKKK